MTKTFRSSFYGTEQPDTLDDEEKRQSVVASARVYMDLENPGGANGSDQTLSSRELDDRDGLLFLVISIASLVSLFGIYYLVGGILYLQTNEEGARGVALFGGVVLAVAGSVMVGGLAVCCCCPQCPWALVGR